MATQLWIRNPEFYIREGIEAGVTNIAWDRGYLIRKGLNPLGFLRLHVGTALPCRILMFGEEGTAEVDFAHPITSPLAVYPTWDYEGDDDHRVLEEIMARPVGLSQDLCTDPATPPDRRPVLGQEHRVCVIRPPDFRSSNGRRFVRLLLGLMEDYPECILHVHGLWDFRPLFAFGWPSVDMDPQPVARGGEVCLPNGRRVHLDDVEKSKQWVHAVGMTTSELSVGRNRCLFNIRSAIWAAEHWRQDHAFRSSPSTPDIAADGTVGPGSPTVIARSGLQSIIGGTPGPNDKVACDSCSLASACKYFREGSVCTLPGSEGGNLARYFKTRDSNLILDGLSEILGLQADRLKEGRRNEEADGELHPEVSKLVNSMFSQGVSLAKLVNPALAAAGASRTQVNVGITAGGATSQALTSVIVAELEAKGIRREDITPDMVLQYGRSPAAIETTSRDG